MTRQWNENDLSHDDIETLNDVEMYMNDFTFWKGGEWFHMSHFMEIQRIYMGWYEGIPQYVGESEHFSRRMGQHLNHNGSKDKTHDPTKVRFLIGLLILMFQNLIQKKFSLKSRMGDD